MASGIRVLIMASSSVYAASLAAELRDPAVEVVGTVYTVPDANARIRKENVELLLVDTRNAILNMNDFIRQIRMTDKKLTIFVICDASDPKIIQYRITATDIIRASAQNTIEDRRMFARNVLFKIKLSRQTKAAPALSALGRWRPGQPFSTRFTGIIAIGASAGGTEATQEVLKDLPPNMPGIVVTQHMPPVFTNVYAQRLDNVCKMRVTEGKDNMPVETGSVIIAQGGVQMRVQKSPQNRPVVRCAGEERVSGHCPSVDVLFDSVARVMGRNAIGVILTGMGADGAVGLLAMRNAGSYTIGQDEKTSMVYGMPHVAFQKGAVVTQLPLGEIGPALVSKLMTL